jgi:hypothetical protein
MLMGNNEIFISGQEITGADGHSGDCPSSRPGYSCKGSKWAQGEPYRRVWVSSPEDIELLHQLRGDLPCNGRRLYAPQNLRRCQSRLPSTQLRKTGNRRVRMKCDKSLVFTTIWQKWYADESDAEQRRCSHGGVGKGAMTGTGYEPQPACARASTA